MNMKKKVAIILRTKDRDIFLKRAIHSILSQTYQNYHVYVVNDGGYSERLENIFEGLSCTDKDRFSLIHLPVSTKRGGALSIGINSSSEDYIHIHDDDDTLEPEFLERTVSYLEKEENENFSGVVTSNYDVYEKITDHDIIEVEKIESYGRRNGSVMDYGLFLAHLTVIAPITFVFRRSVINLIGSVNPTLDYLEDNDFFLRIMQHGDIGIINEFLCSYHWKMSSGNDGKFIPANQQECPYTNDIYKNNMIREAIDAKGTIRSLQADALKDRTITDYNRDQLLKELSVLNNSFLDMINVFNDFIGKIKNR